ncbi:MAG: hypothetical protein LRY54_01550 [Alphaproteobacteria bacterium]|nr:hypothetical protein [Alphaproteobacteria bacterium]
MSTTSPILPNPQPTASKPLTQGETAKIILESASVAVTEDKGRQTLKGEVTGVKPDGTVQVKTEKGAVEILIPPESKAQPPRPGDRIEIDVKPEDKSGSPREVNIRVTERAPQDTRTSSQGTDTRASDAPPPRTSETPVEVRLEPPAPQPPPEESEASARPDTSPPVKGDIVRLQPLPPELLDHRLNSPRRPSRRRL